MEQRLVPEIMEREQASGRPDIGAVLEERGSFARAALHLHHMGDCMHAPTILAVERDSRTAGFLGARIVAGLFEAEGMHAQHIAATGNGGVPMRQDARDAITQHGRIAQEEIAQMRELDRREIARISDRDTAPLLDSLLELAVMPGPKRGDMTAFAVVGMTRQ